MRNDAIPMPSHDSIWGMHIDVTTTSQMEVLGMHISSVVLDFRRISSSCYRHFRFCMGECGDGTKSTKKLMLHTFGGGFLLWYVFLVSGSVTDLSFSRTCEDCGLIYVIILHNTALWEKLVRIWDHKTVDAIALNGPKRALVVRQGMRQRTEAYKIPRKVLISLLISVQPPLAPLTDLEDIIMLRSGLPVPCMTYRLLKHQLANKDGKILVSCQENHCML